MDTIRLFSEVAKCHSFSQAAALHGITQSATSQRISQLERKLGVTLIDRSSRPLRLTEAGQAYLEGVDDILARYDRLERRLSSLAKDPSGHLSVAAIYSAGIELLEQVSQDFQADHDKVRVDIAYAHPDEVYRRVLERECELGIVSYPQRWRKVAVLPLREEAMVVVCSPEHALAQTHTVRPADLSAYEMITFEPELPAGRRIRQYLKDNDASPEIVRCFDNIDTLKNVVAVTDRFSILPLRTVRMEVEAGSLVAVELSPRLTRPIGVIYRPRGKNGEPFTPAAQAFVDFLLEHAGPRRERALDDTLGRLASPTASAAPDSRFTPSPPPEHPAARASL